MVIIRGTYLVYANFGGPFLTLCFVLHLRHFLSPPTACLLTAHAYFTEIIVPRQRLLARCTATGGDTQCPRGFYAVWGPVSDAVTPSPPHYAPSRRLLWSSTHTLGAYSHRIVSVGINCGSQVVIGVTSSDY